MSGGPGGLAPVRWVLFAVATLAFAALTVSLGNWQARRAEEKLARQRDSDDRRAAPALDLARDRRPATDDMFGRRVTVAGTPLDDLTVLLDNRVHQGRVGYEVIMPLRLVGADGRELQSAAARPGLVVRLGRTRDNTVVLDDSSVSKFHAQLTIDDTGTLVLSDLGSTTVSRIRSGSNQGFDRLVLDLKGPAPAWQAEYVDRLVNDGSGEPAPINGVRNLLVVVQATGYDVNTGDPVFQGPNVARPRLTTKPVSRPILSDAPTSSDS